MSSTTTAPRSETLVITGTDRAGTTSAAVNIPITWTALGPVARIPGDPGLTQLLFGQTAQNPMTAIPARALQYAQIVGQAAPLYPAAAHLYIDPPTSTVAGAQGFVANARTVWGWGAYPLIDIKEGIDPNTGRQYSFDQVAAGACDGVFDTLIEGSLQLGRPLGLSYHNEPTGDGLGGAQSYANAVARLGLRVALAGAQNLVTWTGALGQGSFTGFGGGNGPPDLWLQTLAATGAPVWDDHKYLQASDSDGASAWKQPVDVFGKFWDLQDQIAMAERGILLPRFHGEWGVHTRAADLTFAPAWMRTFYAYFLSRNGILATFFDSGQNSPLSWLLDLGGERSRLIAMAQLLALPTTGYRLAA